MSFIQIIASNKVMLEIITDHGRPRSLILSPCTKNHNREDNNVFSGENNKDYC